MPASRDYVAYLLELLSPLGEVKARAMFGGYSLSLDGLTFALVADDTLYFKVDAVNRPAYEALGLGPFVPFPDKPAQTMAYHPPPESVFDDEGELLAWARPAIEAAMRAKAKKKPKKTKAAAG